MANVKILDDEHWQRKDYKQRMTTKKWRQILLSNSDSIVFKGNKMSLKARSLGAGVYEVSKDF